MTRFQRLASQIKSRTEPVYAYEGFEEDLERDISLEDDEEEVTPKNNPWLTLLQEDSQGLDDFDWSGGFTSKWFPFRRLRLPVDVEGLTESYE